MLTAATSAIVPATAFGENENPLEGDPLNGGVAPVDGPETSEFRLLNNEVIGFGKTAGAGAVCVVSGTEVRLFVVEFWFGFENTLLFPQSYGFLNNH